MKDHDDLSLESLAVHSDREHNDTPAVSPPIWQSSTFRADSPEEFLERATKPREDRFYTRYGNPTHTQAAAVIASLEGTEAAMLAASGMGAISSVLLTFLASGDHVVGQRCHYAGTASMLRKFLPRIGVEVTIVDQTDAAGFADAIRPETKLVVVETPSNPLLEITDLAAVVSVARDRGVVTMIDNTFATPINQRPADFGIDLVVHSATKYLGGHSDIVAGAIAGPAALLDRVWDTSIMLGTALSPFDAWLMLRGMRTLPLRVGRQNETALAIARFLEDHQAVERVNYPGLESHPQHGLAARQMRGFGGLLSFELAGGHEAAERFVSRVKIAVRAGSLGGVETLVVHPAAMWAHSYSAETLREIGISPGLVRLAVGIEGAGDLIADLRQALEA